jgi:hypothetical protein
MEHCSNSPLDPVLAFLDARDRERVAICQLVRAAGYEFQWLGKFVTE